MNRRQLIFLPLGLAPVTAYARFVEPVWLQTRRESIAVAGVPAGRPIRIVQLSDFHSSPLVPNALIEQSIDLALDARPDLVCFTGDFITHGQPWYPDWYVPVLRRVSSRVPCAAVLGNHDLGWASQPSRSFGTLISVVQLLEASNVPLLLNRALDMEIRGRKLRLVGIGDLWSSYCDPGTAFAGPEPAADGTPTIVLAHNPDTKDRIADFPWELLLAGHTHGGQVVMPIAGFSPAPVKDKRYVRGLKPWRDRLVYVSAGVGNLDGFRFNCRPEVNVLDLHA